MVGTGVFVSLGLAAGVAGTSVLLALLLAAALALGNGLSSAQLAAAHPGSGGTYEYGYRWLRPSVGFTAGWMFMWAKSASAATAALGLVGYLGRFVPALADLPPALPAATLTLLITALVASAARTGATQYWWESRCRSWWRWLDSRWCEPAEQRVDLSSPRRRMRRPSYRADGTCSTPRRSCS